MRNEHQRERDARSGVRAGIAAEAPAPRIAAARATSRVAAGVAVAAVVAIAAAEQPEELGGAKRRADLLIAEVCAGRGRTLAHRIGAVRDRGPPFTHEGGGPERR